MKAMFFLLIVLGGLHLIVYYGSQRLYRWLDDRAFGHSLERLKLTQRVSALKEELEALRKENEIFQAKLVDVFEVLRPALMGEKSALVLSSDDVRRKLQ